MIRNFIWVALGGACGSVARYALTLLSGVLRIPSEYAILSANISGSFLIGVFLSLARGELYLFAAIGFCGGFTTFSTFSSQTLALLQSGQKMSALFYIFSSVALSLLAVYLGLILGDKWFK